MKNPINKPIMISNNQENIFNRKTASNIAIIINAKFLSFINNIFSIVYKSLIQSIINEKNQK